MSSLTLINIAQIFEDWASQGYCPALLYDDNGHWTVSFDGIQNIPRGENPVVTDSTFFVDKDSWKDTVIDAVLHAQEVIKELEKV